MKNILKNILTIIGLFSGIIFTTYTYANYIEKTISVENGEIKYFEIGSGKPVLMIHGLFANKKQWLGLINNLTMIEPDVTKTFQFIIPDLAGYGRSTNYPLEVYNLDSNDPKNSLNQIKILHSFVEKLNIKSKINLVGSSMGGLIMTLYAMSFPTEVQSIAFIGSPAGIADYTDIFVNSGFRQGFNPMIPTTIEQFKKELYLLLVDYKAIMPSDEEINIKIIPNYKENYIKLTAAFNMIHIKTYREYLRKKLPLTQPALVLWGKQDLVFGSDSYAKDLCNNLHKSKKCSFYSIPNAGHLILKENKEVLKTSAEYYLKFLNETL